MSLITVEHLTHSYTDRKLFNKVSFHLSEGEKIGIIGVNGTGKSTFLKILAGEEVPEEGKIVMRRNLQLAYLPQNPVFEQGESVLQAALPRGGQISGEPAEYEPEAKNYLMKLGFTDMNQRVEELSGGQRKRVALVRVLLTPCDVYILDEPTNHLDSAMAEWLENYLRSSKKGLIMITHDRYFLDCVVNRIVEMDKGSLYSYDCSYEGYLERKAEREEIALAAERKRQSILRKEIAWIQRGARARSTKQKAHIARYEKLRDTEMPESDRTIQIAAGSQRLGKTTVELQNIGKSYGGKCVIGDFTYTFLRTDRVGIVGANGCGKSTLLKMIVGELPPDSGTIVIGQTVKIGYFSQDSDSMDGSLRVIDYVREGGEVIHTREGDITASALLERFLFSPNMQYAPVSKLSGGERRRLYLLRVLMESPNVLLLDEPTNDLDIASLTILEDYLDSFDGIVVAVSHDRYFLDRIATRIFAFEGDGSVRQYEGGYTDYQNKTGHVISVKGEGNDSLTTGVEKGKKVNRNNWKENAPKKLKMSYKEQREYETIEEDIAAIEEAIQKCEEDIMAYARDFVKLNEVTEKKEELESELLEKMERWEYLEELAEKIEGQ